MHHWMGWEHGMGWGWGLVMIAFWVLAILGVVFLVRLVLGRGSGPAERGGASSTGETALDVLKKRYARGEISREEYARMKDELQ